MPVANLQIVINSNAEQAIAGMQRFGAVSKEQFGNNVRAIDAYAESVTVAANQAVVASKLMSQNMSQASTSIETSAGQAQAAVRGIEEAANDVDLGPMSAKVRGAFMAAFGGGYTEVKTTLSEIKDTVASQLETVGLGLAIGLVSATAGVLYAAYQVASGVIGFAAGLITGESYKSESIDRLIAANSVILELQTNIGVSAAEAGALADAFSRLGVDKSTYVDVHVQAAKAVRENRDELDRLGVTYKDQNGKLLETEQFLGNVKSKLDEYNQGYDRTAAAAAIGVGSYEKINQALLVNEGQIVQSKRRLDEYNLGISSDTQQAVAKYEDAMRRFDNESRLTSEGFRRAIADAIMPALTRLANFFVDGFPKAVLVFRYAVASLATAFYGVDTAGFILFETLSAGFEVTSTLAVAAAGAIKKAFSGDFAGAKSGFLDGLSQAQERALRAGDAMADRAVANQKAIKSAFAMDDRNQSLESARNSMAGLNTGGKTFVPKPDSPGAVGGQAAVSKPFDRYIEDLERMITKSEQGEYAMLRLKAAQEAAKQKGLDGIEAISRADEVISKIQRADSERAVNSFADKLQLENRAVADQIGLLGMTAGQQELVTAALKRRREAEQLVIDAKKSGKPLDDEAIASLRLYTEAQVQAQDELIRSRQQAERRFSTGANLAFAQYVEDAGNAARQGQNLVANSFRAMEDFVIKFAKTGKLAFGDLVDGILSDLLRIQIQRTLTMPLAQALSGGGDFLGSLFGFAASSVAGSGGGDLGSGLRIGSSSGSVDSFASAFGLSKNAVGMPYVPRDMLAMVHEGESIVPKGGSGGVVVNIVESPGQGGTQSMSNDGGVDVLTVFVEKVKSSVAMDISRGSGDIPSAFARTYGLNRVAGAY